MHSYSSFDFSIIPTGESSMPAASDAVRFGHGCFTTIAVRSGKPIFWDLHFERLSTTAIVLGLEFCFTSEQLSGEIGSLIDKNEEEHCTLRISLLSRSNSLLDHSLVSKGTSVLIQSRAVKDSPSGFRVTRSDRPLSINAITAGLKTLNYLEPIMAFNTARKAGFDEILRTNEHGLVVSASLANLFWFSGEQFFTPALGTGCLAGTTRKKCIELTDANEVEVSIEELDSADGAFLTSAAYGAVPIHNIGDQFFEKPELPLLLTPVSELFSTK